MKKLQFFLPFLALLSILLVTRIFALDKFVTTDEIAWFFRSGNFYYAISHFDLAKTDFGASIAVFTMWINTMAFLLKFPLFRGVGQGYLDNYDPRWSTIFSENNITEVSVVATGRLLMVISMIILALFIYWYLNRSVGVIPAFFSCLFIALNPFYIALSRTSHLDAPMGTFLMVSVLSYHTYIFKDKRTFDLVISGVSGGFSFLSKLPGLLTIPCVIGTSILYLFSGSDWRIQQKWKIFIKAIADQGRIFIIWSVLFIVTIVIVWPAMWVGPINLIMKTVATPGRFSVFIEDIENDESLPDRQTSTPSQILNKTQTIWSTYKSYVDSFLWRTSPAVLLGLLMCLVGYFFQIGIFQKIDARNLAKTLVILVFIFLLFTSFSQKTSEKYITPVYLSLDILAGFGWISILSFISAKLSKRFEKAFLVSSLVVVLISQAMLVWDNYPYFFTFYNPLRGGSKRAGESHFVGVGEGLDEAARFLNQLPGADRSKAISWYGLGPFSFYFDGKTSIIPTGIQWSDGFQARLKKSDYLVVYTNQWYRSIPPELFVILDKVKPIHRVWIEDIEYARIYRIDDISLP